MRRIRFTLWVCVEVNLDFKTLVKQVSLFSLFFHSESMHMHTSLACGWTMSHNNLFRKSGLNNRFDATTVCNHLYSANLCSSADQPCAVWPPPRPWAVAPQMRWPIASFKLKRGLRFSHRATVMWIYPPNYPMGFSVASRYYKTDSQSLDTTTPLYMFNSNIQAMTYFKRLWYWCKK